MVSRRDIFRSAFIGCTCIGIMFIAIVLMAFDTDNVWESNGGIEAYNGWYYYENGEKVYINGEDGEAADHALQEKTIVIYNILPQNTDMMSLFFNSYHQTVEVFVEDEQIYEFGTDNNLIFGKSVGSGHHLINLSSAYSGKEIKVKLVCAYNNASRRMPVFRLGSAYAIVTNYIRNQMPALIINFLIFLIGMIFFIAEIGLNHKLRSKKNFYLGTFAICYSIYSMLQTSIIQMFFNNQLFIMYLSYLMVMIIPISVILFVREHYSLYSDKILSTMIMAFMANFLMTIILQLMNVADFKETLIVTHILMLISMVYTLVIIYQKRKKKILIASTFSKVLCVIIAFTIALDLYRYYYAHVWDTTRYSRLGILALMLIFGFNYLKSYIEKAGKYTEARILAKLAYKDVMTDMYNRTAYMEHIESLDERFQQGNSELKNVIYVLFDLNNLKTINDKLGHTMGDYYIVSMSKIIKKAFENIGKCYRIGGDEFAVIIENREEWECDESITNLEEMITLDNERNDHNFSIACGYSVTCTKDYTSMQDLINEADRHMYENKKLYKMSMLTKPVVQI